MSSDQFSDKLEVRHEFPASAPSTMRLVEPRVKPGGADGDGVRASLSVMTSASLEAADSEDGRLWLVDDRGADCSPKMPELVRVKVSRRSRPGRASAARAFRDVDDGAAMPRNSLLRLLDDGDDEAQSSATGADVMWAL